MVLLPLSLPYHLPENQALKKENTCPLVLPASISLAWLPPPFHWCLTHFLTSCMVLLVVGTRAAPHNRELCFLWQTTGELGLAWPTVSALLTCKGKDVTPPCKPTAYFIHILTQHFATYVQVPFKALGRLYHKLYSSKCPAIKVTLMPPCPYNLSQCVFKNHPQSLLGN